MLEGRNSTQASSTSRLVKCLDAIFALVVDEGHTTAIGLAPVEEVPVLRKKSSQMLKFCTDDFSVAGEDLIAVLEPDAREHLRGRRIADR